jgi:hypothetical protein
MHTRAHFQRHDELVGLGRLTCTVTKARSPPAMPGLDFGSGTRFLVAASAVGVAAAEARPAAAAAGAAVAAAWEGWGLLDRFFSL